MHTGMARHLRRLTHYDFRRSDRMIAFFSVCHDGFNRVSSLSKDTERTVVSATPSVTIVK